MAKITIYNNIGKYRDVNSNKRVWIMQSRTRCLARASITSAIPIANAIPCAAAVATRMDATKWITSAPARPTVVGPLSPMARSIVTPKQWEQVPSALLSVTRATRSLDPPRLSVLTRPMTLPWACWPGPSHSGPVARRNHAQKRVYPTLTTVRSSAGTGWTLINTAPFNATLAFIYRTSGRVRWFVVPIKTG